jgi:hypothetical protein
MHHPNNGTPSAAGNPPTSKQINYSSRHNPRQPETFEEDIPISTSNLTMKKKVICRLSILFTHNTPIHLDDGPLLERIFKY